MMSVERARNRLAVATLSILLLGVVGCSDQGTADVPFIVHPDRGEITRDALVRGILEMRDGCLFVISESTESEYVLSFREGTGWRADGTVTLAGTQLKVGEEIEIGSAEGGSVAELRAIAPEGFHIPEACPGDAQIWTLD